MRRLALPAVAMSLAVGLGVASAATIRGTIGADRLTGTAVADNLFGLDGNDTVEGLGGDDYLHGGAGRDLISGGDGNDRVTAQEDDTDRVRCGAGRDVVNAGLGDTVAADCEVVSRQLSRDPYAIPDVQHATQVEPDSYSWGRTMVSTFQVGRDVDGGAANIGWATTTNGGRSWRSGMLPGLSSVSRPAGDNFRVSDPVVTYDAARRFWLIASLGIAEGRDRLLVSRSGNGVRWNAPVVAVEGPDETVDKEWIVCDNWTASPFRGHCYLAYLDLRSGRIVVRTSTDGAITWSAPAYASASPGADEFHPNGAHPVVRPNGELVVLYVDFGLAVAESIVSIRSLDGGRTFTSPSVVARMLEQEIRGVRAPPFPSAEVDAAGRIYAAWHDCRYPSFDCVANEIMFATSADGQNWTEPTRVPIRGDFPTDVDYFVPGLAVDRASLGSHARVAIAYHSLPQCGGSCRVMDVGLITSENGGRTWSRPQRLSSQSMQLLWLAQTSLGYMTGDYISTSYLGGRAVPVYSLASALVAGRFRQATFAMTRGRPLFR